MTLRALIIAVEDYPHARTVARKLSGTIAAADRFAHWLHDCMGIDPAEIVFCCTGASSFRTDGATRNDIKDALVKLIRRAAGDTTRLLVYITGHGVLKPGRTGQQDTNVLLCSDFVDSSVSGDCCIQIDELVLTLARCLGAGEHVHFVDVCRSVDETLSPVGLGLQCPGFASGPADWFELFSAPAMARAASDTLFIDSLLEALGGDCLLQPEAGVAGWGWITFQGVVDRVNRAFAAAQRPLEWQSVARQPDANIRRVPMAGPVATIVDESGLKVPPLELLATHDEAIFLGETNGQLPRMLEAAFARRQNRRWTRIDVLSIDDLSTAGRLDTGLSALEKERDDAEAYLQEHAARLTDSLALYRYDYAGTYGSFWIAADGRRHAHVSPKLQGMDIRTAPARDFVDYVDKPLRESEQYFMLARRTLEQARGRCIFAYPNVQAKS